MPAADPGGPRFVGFVERGVKAPTRWRLEHVEHPELPVWLATAHDDAGELLVGVSLASPDSLEAHARRHGAKLEPKPEPKLESGPVRSRAATQLSEYLDGERRHFDLRLFGFGTAFEQQAWLALMNIPFGETRSYGQQARMLDAPGAARAVGRANGRNPLPIVVPCHRVIGSDGTLTGFAGGLALKRWLLAHEGVRLGNEAGPRMTPREQLPLF